MYPATPLRGVPDVRELVEMTILVGESVSSIADLRAREVIGIVFPDIPGGTDFRISTGQWPTALQTWADMLGAEIMQAVPVALDSILVDADVLSMLNMARFVQVETRTMPADVAALQGDDVRIVLVCIPRI